MNKNNINKCDYLQRLGKGSNLCSPVNICTMDLKIIRAITEVTSNKSILYTRRLVVYRNQRRWWCKKQGNKACD